MNEIKNKLFKAIENDKEELFGILSDLIKINSENFGAYGNEEECANFIAKYFEELGFIPDVYSPLEIPSFESHEDYYAGRHLENRKNCNVVVKGNGSDRKLMLAAHLDTVEVGNPDTWKFPPLCGDIKDGKILGRGACDDKYGLAISMFLIKKLKELGIKLDYDLVFTAYCDEEYGGGNGALAASLKYPCDDCINIDGLENEIWDSGVGGGELIFKVKSKTSEDNCSKVLKGLNMVVEKLESFKKKRQEELQANPIFTDTVIVKNAMRIMTFNVGESGGVNMDRGQFKITLYTDRSKEQIFAELDEIKKSLSKPFEDDGLEELEIEMCTRFFHYVEGEKNSCMVDMLSDSAKENGMPLKHCGACLSDLPMFTLHCSPRSVMLGLGRDFGSEGGAHQSNEYVECDKLVALTKIIADVLLKY